MGKKLYPDECQCENLWRRYHTPDQVIAHCKAVRNQSLKIVDDLKSRGIQVNLELIQSAALLHDLARTENNHPEVGAKILISEGYEAVAESVRQHHDIQDDATIETKIVYLADKQIQGIEEISLEQRFECSYSKCDTSEAKAAHQMRKEQAMKVESDIKNYMEEKQ